MVGPNPATEVGLEHADDDGDTVFTRPEPLQQQGGLWEAQRCGGGSASPGSSLSRMLRSQMDRCCRKKAVEKIVFSEL